MSEDVVAAARDRAEPLTADIGSHRLGFPAGWRARAVTSVWMLIGRGTHRTTLGGRQTINLEGGVKSAEISGAGDRTISDTGNAPGGTALTVSVGHQ